MRNPNRIDGVIETLRAAWKICPDLRLGQLLLATTDDVAPKAFYREDDVWIEKLSAFAMETADIINRRGPR
jgi:uncharacterized protein YihD (DUF1040 family)